MSGNASYYFSHVSGTYDELFIYIGNAPLCNSGCSIYSAIEKEYYTTTPSTWLHDSGYVSGTYYNVPAGYNSYYMDSSYQGSGLNGDDRWDWGEMTMTWYPPAP